MTSSTTAQPVASASVLVASFDLNTKERIRVELDEYCGRPIVNVRRWFTADDGQLKPTRKGLALSVRHLPELARVVAEARDHAIAIGLLQTSEGST